MLLKELCCANQNIQTSPGFVRVDLYLQFIYNSDVYILEFPFIDWKIEIFHFLLII